MGEWKTVYEDEVEGRWVILKVYESEDGEEDDDAPVVRVTVAPIDEAGEPEPKAASEADADADAEDNSVTLDPDAVEDLEEELIEIGFSPEAATWIVNKVPR